MLQLTRIPELGQRDRFVRRAVAEGHVLTLADEQSASVPSQKYAGCIVQLFWSSPIEARRWAEALSGDDALQEIPLQTFAADILPGIGAAKGLAGTDWVSDPIEAEVDPADLVFRLKRESIAGFIRRLAAQGEVYLVAGQDGPLVEPVRSRQGEVMRLAIFDDRIDAERHVRRSAGRTIITDPIGDFRASTLAWAAERGYEVGFEPIQGAGLLDLKAAEFSARF